MADAEIAVRTEPVYAMGYSDEERRRLIDQARLLEDSTRRLFVEAAIGDGMTVLDIGCGVGDVSFVAASLVGNGGRVVGVDRDPRALAVARDRAANLGLANVDFIQSDINTFEPDGAFDALVGRLVLLYLVDPAEVLRSLIRAVRPGGVIAFQDYQFDYAAFNEPNIAMMDQFWEWFVATFHRAGLTTSMGLKLYETFIRAGLPAPRLTVEHPLIYAADPRWMAMPEMVLRSILPLMERFGIATADEVDVDTWTERLSRQVIGRNSVSSGPMIFGAWSNVPEL